MLLDFGNAAHLDIWEAQILSVIQSLRVSKAVSTTDDDSGGGDGDGDDNDDMSELGGCLARHLPAPDSTTPAVSFFLKCGAAKLRVDCFMQLYRVPGYYDTAHRQMPVSVAD